MVGYYFIISGLRYLISSVSRTPLPLARYAHLLSYIIIYYVHYTYIQYYYIHYTYIRYYYILGRARALHTQIQIHYSHIRTRTHAHGLIRIDQCNCRQLYIVGGYLYTHTHTPDIIVDIYIYIYIILYTPRRSIQRARCQQHIYDAPPNSTISSCRVCVCVCVPPLRFKHAV